jgi:hypothetical protein
MPLAAVVDVGDVMVLGFDGVGMVWCPFSFFDRCI